jgi:SAM-dependent methyltransferase
MGETQKSHAHRLQEGWFEKYAPEDKIGLDLGCHKDPLNKTFRRWDLIFGDSDATFLEGVPDNLYHTVYASHLLEHLDDPVLALKNWYRVLKPEGYLIVIVPHRDLYECKKELPSYWAPEHKFYYLPNTSEPPCTRSFFSTINEAIPEANIVLFRVLDKEYHRENQGHPQGEYAIEAIIKK